MPRHAQFARRQGAISEQPATLATLVALPAHCRGEHARLDAALLHLARRENLLVVHVAFVFAQREAKCVLAEKLAGIRPAISEIAERELQRCSGGLRRQRVCRHNKWSVRFPPLRTHARRTRLRPGKREEPRIAPGDEVARRKWLQRVLYRH